MAANLKPNKHFEKKLLFYLKTNITFLFGEIIPRIVLLELKIVSFNLRIAILESLFGLFVDRTARGFIKITKSEQRI